MYCIKCGVELSKGQKKCPLCQTEVIHPDFLSLDGDETYPKKDTPPEKFDQKGLMFIVTMLFAIPFILCLVCDLSLNNRMLWSGYAMGALALIYVVMVLPFWFIRPNPVIFVPCDFGALILYVLYINFQTQGSWFFPFALPAIFVLGLITTAVVAIRRYVRRGRLYVYGGATIAAGAYAVLLELLISYVFGGAVKFIWSIYPLIAFFILGMMLIIIAICKPLRQSLKRKFFI